MKEINFEFKRCISALLMLAMLLSLLPGGVITLQIHAAETADIGVFYTDPEGWGSVYGYVWEIGTENPDWPGEKLSVDPNSGYYFLDLSSYKGKQVGVIFNNGSNGMQTADLKLPKLSSGDRFWVSSRDRYTDENALYCTYAPGDGPKAVIHFNAKAAGWSNVGGYAWYEQNGLDPKPELTSGWPGRVLEKNLSNDGWFDLILYDLPVDDFFVIFNDGKTEGAQQTADLPISVAGEYWVDGRNASPNTQAPAGWSTENRIFTVTVHYYNSDNWNAVHNYVWDDNGKSDYCAYWPGRQIAENPDHPGWYDLTLENVETNHIHCIFNNGSSGDGNQTANIDIFDLESKDRNGKVEVWYINGSLTEQVPAQWTKGYTYSSSRKIYIPGTFPGNEWDAASNGMTYTGSDGIYCCTFKNVPAGTYEFKIAVNGSWDENYGYAGVAGGDNYSVTLDQAQDITVWYSDVSHLAVTSLEYDLNTEVTLSGMGLTNTRLYDKRLTGTYSTTLNLAPGTYSGLKLTAGTSLYQFDPFTLEEAKAITFFLSPATGLYYHNADTGKPIDPNKVYYSTKDAEFKSIMGAVPNTAQTTFRIRTGTDVKLAEMVIGRGAELIMTVAMKGKTGDDGTVLWSCNPNFSKCALGDNYWYYFVLRSEAGDVKVYSDDIGDWGTGKLTTLGQEWSYNLVVYKNGFTTPDWLKNAVIYQIFPDRFFNADADNDDDQTTARGDVDYEFPSWEQLPENPSVLGNPNYPSTAYKGDGQYSNEIYGGDLKGITQKIEYLKALGVTVIYLNPIFSSISNHRYDACDYTKIDPILGTLGDFTELVDAAEANGMHIVLDGVFNHVSDDSVYFDRYYKYLGKSEKVGAYPYWAYVYDLVNSGKSLAKAEEAAKGYFKNVYGITDFSYTEWFQIKNEKCSYSDTIGLRKGQPVYAYEGWWGYDSMPVIYSTNGSEYQTGNWAEEIIYNEDGTSVTQYWITQGNDGWRLDVANEVSNETWQRFRESVKSMNSKNVTVLSDGSTTYDDADDAAIIGEIWSDAAYYLLGDMYDSVMNYLFRDAAAGFARTYRINRDNKEYNLDDDYTALDALNTLESTRERYPQEAFYAMMNLVGSHDTARILSYLDGVEDDGWGNNDINNAYPTYAKTGSEAKALQYMVALIQFTYPGAPTIYYGDEIGMVGSDDPDDRRAFEWGKGQQALVEWYALLAQIRSQYATLRTGTVEPFAPTRDVMGYVRRGEDTFIVLANRLGTAQKLRLNLLELNVQDVSIFTDLLTGNQSSANGGMLTVTVPAHSGLILKAGNASKVTLSANSAAALRQAWTNTPVPQDTKWTVKYAWTDAPDGVTLPADATVTDGDSITVDTTYTSGYSVPAADGNGRWVFSGWSNTGTVTVKGNITFIGKWTYEKAGQSGTVTPPASTVPTTEPTTAPVQDPTGEEPQPSVPVTQPDATEPSGNETGPEPNDPAEDTEPVTGNDQPTQGEPADPTQPASDDATEPSPEDTTEPSTEEESTGTSGETVPPGSQGNTAAPGADTPSTPSDGMSWWAVPLLVIGGAAAGSGGYFGYMYYLKKKKQ